MLEIDLLLNAFLDHPAGYAELAPTEREIFDRLLAQPDNELLPWLMDKENPPDPAWQHVITRIRAAQH